MNIKDLRDIAATMKRVGIDEETIVDITLELNTANNSQRSDGETWRKITLDEYKAHLFAQSESSNG